MTEPLRVEVQKDMAAFIRETADWDNLSPDQLANELLEMGVQQYLLRRNTPDSVRAFLLELKGTGRSFWALLETHSN